MRLRRAAVLAAMLPLALYAYACSDDTENPDPKPNDGEETGTGTDGSTNTDGNTGVDGSTPTDGSITDSGGDADGGAITCVGNPLTADGGTPDGGATLDGGARQLTITFPLITASPFLDGPQWIQNDAGGALVFTQVQSDPPQVLRTGANGGAATVVRSGPVGQASLPIGNATRDNVIYTAVANNGGGTATIWQTRLSGDAGANIGVGTATNPNDLVIHPNGTIYFTDPQYQTNPAGDTAVYRIAPDGGVQQLQKNLPRPNGIALNGDATKLYVGLAPAPGDPVGAQRGILVFDVAASGAVTVPGTAFLSQADLTDVPDGIAVDVGGNLWVAEAAANGDDSGRVEVFNSAKRKLGTIPFPTQRPTGIAFGGADGKTVYITTQSNVWAYDSRCAGVR